MPARGSLWRAVLAVSVALALGGCGSGKGAGTTPVPLGALKPAGPEQLGASVNRLFNDLSYSGAEIEAQLRALRANGASVARSDALWERTETQPPRGGRHFYDWRFDDDVAASLSYNHLRWLPVLDYSAGWDQSSPGAIHSPPREPADFAAFSRAFARRYGTGGRFWTEHPGLPRLPVQTFEIWNEPDNPRFWEPRPDPRAYAALYAQARAAIRSADPTARVIVGGLTDPPRFIPALLAADPGLRNTTDGVAIHPYGRDPFVVLKRVRNARRVLSRLGLEQVPLYVTEFGWVTSPRGARDWAPSRLRPRYLRLTLQALGHTNCDVAAAIVYTWVTPERNPRNPEDWFGIHPLTGRRDADTTAFGAGLRLATLRSSPLTLC